MAAGVAVTAAIPLAAAAMGYGIIKGVKSFFTDDELSSESIDYRWEKNKCGTEMKIKCPSCGTVNQLKSDYNKNEKVKCKNCRETLLDI